MSVNQIDQNYQWQSHMYIQSLEFKKLKTISNSLKLKNVTAK